jgi:transcription termination/antitermination protein NusG
MGNALGNNDAPDEDAVDAAPPTESVASDEGGEGDAGDGDVSEPEPAAAAAPVAPSASATSPGVALPPPPPPGAEKKWYIVHTYSGHENKAKLTLLERVRNANLTEWFGDVLVPTESVMEVVKGQRRTTTRKFFPGYMFVQMILDDRTFHLVKNTPKITGFLGGTKPTPVPEREITGVQTNMSAGSTKPKARVVFEVGDSVRVIEGPFANFQAKVEDVKSDKQKLKVSLSFLGRPTTVELDFGQVEKA